MDRNNTREDRRTWMEEAPKTIIKSMKFVIAIQTIAVVVILIHGSWTRVLEILRESGYNTVQENRRGGDPMPELEIEELKSRFVQALSPVSVYLFGSYADGSYTGESDFDFYIVVEDSTDDLADLTTRAYQSIRNVKQRPVDILVSTKSKFDYRKTIPSVENDVYRKGVLLYGR